MSLPKLPSLGIRDVDETTLRLDAENPNVPEQSPQEKYAPYPPFNSAGEVFVWEFIHPKDPYWIPQVQVGNPRVSGSTRVDFINELRRIALYPEGEYFHRRDDAQDLMKYAGVKARGYRVVLFYYTDLDDCIERFPNFYAEQIG